MQERGAQSVGFADEAKTDFRAIFDLGDDVHAANFIEFEQQLSRAGTKTFAAKPHAEAAPHRQAQEADQNVSLDPLLDLMEDGA